MLAEIELRTPGDSALTSGEIPVSNHDSVNEIGDGISGTYVPASNTIFFSNTLGWAELLGRGDIFVAANELDHSGCSGGRPEYIEAFENMANIATKAAVKRRRRLRIHAPLLHLSTAEIIRKGLALGVGYGATSTCYHPAPAEEACGACDACLRRRNSFEENGLEDPAPHRRAEEVTA